jgi:anthranilate phosphoribosyltransferase
MSDIFRPFIKAIGAGKRSGRYLTEDEAYTAMTMLLKGEVTLEQKGAFLMLLRVREESIEELTGFVRACRHMLPAVNNADLDLPSVDIDIACYAGKRRQLPWFLLALSVLQQKGYRLFIHGTAEPLSTRLYVKDTLSQLGLLPALQAKTGTEAFQNLRSRGLAYMDLADIHAPLNDIIQLRDAFGLRSCANTLARLLNPLNAHYCVQGVHHQGVDEKHMGIAAKLYDKHVLCYRGEGGEPEINPAKSTQLHFYRHGQNSPFTTAELPAKQTWQIKPKTLDVASLLSCWEGKSKHDSIHHYAVNTVISSLTPIIMMIKSVPLATASALASIWWEQRNRQELLSVDLDTYSRSQILLKDSVREWDDGATN